MTNSSSVSGFQALRPLIMSNCQPTLCVVAVLWSLELQQSALSCVCKIFTGHLRGLVNLNYRGLCAFSLALQCINLEEKANYQLRMDYLR